MPKTHAFSKEQKEEIKEAIKHEKETKIYKKLHVLQLRADGKKCEEVAEITGYSKSRVSSLVCEYMQKGISYIAEEQRKGGNHRKMSLEEETEFLQGFSEMAKEGHILTVGEIRKAYEEKTCEPSAPSAIYYVLSRHGWRKIMPRSKHPKKASEEAIDAYKKLTKNGSK